MNKLSHTHILITACTLGILTIQGVLLWNPWRQDVSVILPTISSDVSPSRVEMPYGTVQTDYTKIVDPAGIETRITLDEYASIKIGMSYEDTIKIIGGTGLLFNRTEAGGYVFATYMYYGDDRGANANFTFQDDKLISRTSFGLK